MISPLQLTIFLILKFFVIFVLPYFIFWHWWPNRFVRWRIMNGRLGPPQLRSEIFYSILTLLISALILQSLFFLMPEHLFYKFGERGLSTEIMAIAGYLIIYDGYFYWSHRLLHLPWLYRMAHVVHHRSVNPNPLSSYSFHPVEAAINLIYLYIVVGLFPMSLMTLSGLLILTDFGNLVGHLGYDFFPKSIGRILTTPTHHNLHHQYPRRNFGLYWVGWDRIFKTESRKCV